MAKRKPGKLNADRRRHLVSTVRAILKTGRPTHFAFEAACRYGLRIKLVLEGWRWIEADQAAADVVALALRTIGARRPSWYQGQPAYTEDGHSPIEHTHCMRCRKPLEQLRSDQGLALRFCSNACRVASRRTVEQRTREDYFDAMRAAGGVKRMERMTSCPNCGVEFVPKKPQWPPDPAKPRYCSNRCSKQHFFVKRRHGVVVQEGTQMSAADRSDQLTCCSASP